MKKQIDIGFGLECDIVKHLSKKLGPADNPMSWNNSKSKKQIAVMDPANIILVIAKTDHAKLMLCRFVEYDWSPKKIPSLDYHAKEESCSMFSTSYVLWAVEFFKLLGDSVTVKVRYDYPLTLESEDFVIVLAPRIENR